MKFEDSKSNTKNSEIALLELKINEKFDKMHELMETVSLFMEKAEQCDVEEIGDVKDQVLAILEDNPKSLSILHKYTKINKRLLLDVLKVLKDDGFVQLDNSLWRAI